MNTNPLVGKTIQGVQLTADKRALRFKLDDGTEVVARCDGDCCSSTWVEHISLPALGFPALVTEAEDVPMPDLGTPPEFECLAYYGFQVTTDKGHMVIDYRNESNGYYGGSLSWPGEYHYGGVHGQNDADESEWIEVTQDI